jgi:hypothetical protein
MRKSPACILSAADTNRLEWLVVPGALLRNAYRAVRRVGNDSEESVS